jgi:adenylosuccinate lyase
MMTENLMMEGVRRGGDRQVLHERVRIHSHAATSGDDLLQRIAGDSLRYRSQDLDAMANRTIHRPFAPADGRFVIEDVDRFSRRMSSSAEHAEVRV